MTGEAYAYPVGRIRVLETKLFNKSALERMIEAPDYQGVLSILGEYGYEISGLPAGERNIRAYEAVLADAEMQPCFTVRSFAPEPELFDLFFLKQDYYNAKVLLKGEWLGKEMSSKLSPYGTIPVKSMIHAFSDRNFSVCPPELALSLRQLTEDAAPGRDVRKMEFLLDRSYYRDCFLLAEHAQVKASGHFVKRYLQISADLSNIKTVLRLKSMEASPESRIRLMQAALLPGTFSLDFLKSISEMNFMEIRERLADTPYAQIMNQAVTGENEIAWYALERNSDDYILQFVKKDQYNAFGIAPLFGYILARQREVMAARMIILGKINGLRPETVRMRIREFYV